MSELPPPIDQEPTRDGEATNPEQRGRDLPRRGYDRRMKPPPPPPPPQRKTAPPAGMYTPPPPGGGARPPRRQPPRGTKRDSGLYFPWWSLVILVGVVGACALGTVYMIAEDPFGFTSNPGDATPAVVVVTSEFNNNNRSANPGPPGAVPTSAPQVVPSQVPQAAPTATTAAGVATGCPTGAEVFVSGTSNDGLIIREEPRQGNNIVIVADEGERFTITAGPERSVGVGGETLEWCKLEGIDNTLISGWAAAEFLTLSNP